MSNSVDLLQGTLDMLILRTVAPGPMHGWGISQRIQQVSEDVLRVNQGSLYPALHRLEEQGWISAEWGASENGRRAKFYSLTKSGPPSPGRGDPELGAPGRGGEPRSRNRLRRSRHALVEQAAVASRRAPPRRGPGARHGRGAPIPRGDGDAGQRKRGLAPEEARRAALVSFGGVERVKDECRDSWGVRLRRDLAPGRALRPAEPPREPGLHPGRGPDPGPGHRGQHRDLQRRERRPPAAAALRPGEQLVAFGRRRRPRASRTWAFLRSR